MINIRIEINYMENSTRCGKIVPLNSFYQDITLILNPVNTLKKRRKKNNKPTFLINTATKFVIKLQQIESNNTENCNAYKQMFIAVCKSGLTLKKSIKINH